MVIYFPVPLVASRPGTGKSITFFYSVGVTSRSKNPSRRLTNRKDAAIQYNTDVHCTLISAKDKTNMVKIILKEMCHYICNLHSNI